MKLLKASMFVAALALSIPSAWAATLAVGPNKQFQKPSQAINAAHDGEVILIDADGNYDGDVARVRAKNLTIRGVGKGRERPVLDCKGRDEGGKGIFVQSGEHCTIENIEFVGARCADKNGAGIRGEAAGLTVRNCRFYNCQNGILGGVGEVLVENCEFDHCGPVAEPATHSCYFNAAITKLTFKGNYSTFVKEGHLLKSRAKENWILYNRLTDEQGTGSAVADFPNGGLVVLIGNVLHKGSKGQNDRMIAYGMEGIKHAKNALYVVNNTMVYEHRHIKNWFVRVEHPPQDFSAVIRNNVCVGPIPLTNAPQADAAGNLLFKKTAEPGFVDAAGFDFHLVANSPCIGQGASSGKVGDVSLAPELQYVHPCKTESRPTDAKLDVGAFEFLPTAGNR